MKEKLRNVLLYPVLVAIVLVAAACGQPNGQIPGTGDQVPGLTGTPPVSSELPPEAVLDAQAWLSEQLQIPVEQVGIVSMAQEQWTDSCLGLGQPNESCAQVETPGWRVVFVVNGQEYAVRTDETGSVVRPEEPLNLPDGG